MEKQNIRSVVVGDALLEFEKIINTELSPMEALVHITDLFNVVYSAGLREGQQRIKINQN